MKALARRKVLVLNKSWSPVGVIGLQRAIGLLFSAYMDGQPKAVIVDPESFSTFSWKDWAKLRPEKDEDVIRGVREYFRVPEVIVLMRYDKLPTHRVTFSRRTIYKRDNYECQYCGASPGSEELTIDHIVPRSRGGQTTWTNCVLSCLKCNAKKANHTLNEVNMKLRRQPFKPKYQLFKGDGVVCDSWRKFLSEAYWRVEISNDMPD